MRQEDIEPNPSSTRPRTRRSAAGVVAQYIHELSERHAEAARRRTVALAVPISAQAALSRAQTC